MRRLSAWLGVGVLVLTGCSGAPVYRDRANNNRPVGETPQAANLVAYLNDNARRISSLEFTRVSIDCKAGNQATPGIEAMVACQRPNSFRLKGDAVGNSAVDLGSNTDEFWFWTREPKPAYVYHCSHADLKQGTKLPLPIHPEMILTAFGVTEYDNKANYTVRVNERSNPKTVELIEETKSPAGAKVFRVTVFNATQAAPGKPQVVAHVLRNEQGKDVCTATIYEVQTHKDSGAVLPQRVKVVYTGDKPEERFELTMRLADARVGKITPQRAELLFNRKELNNLPGFDLSKGEPDGQPLQRVRGASE